MQDIETLRNGLRCIAGIDGKDLCNGCHYRELNEECDVSVAKDALALLKEHEEQVQQWTKEIADYQLAHAPKDSHEFMSLDEHLKNEYKRGIWDGLQIAWNIISEGR
jgi:hypothetical protein